MKISIITSTYNSAAEVENFITTINSITKINKLKKIELIFIDDASTDSTISALKENLRKDLYKYKIYRSDINLGQHYSIIQGIKLATGDVIITLDIDSSKDIVKLIDKALILLKDKNINCIVGINKNYKTQNIYQILSKFYHFCVKNFSYNKIYPQETSIRFFSKKIKKNILINFYKYIPNIFIYAFSDKKIKKNYLYFKKKFNKKSSYNLKKRIIIFIFSIYLHTSILPKFIGLFLILFTITFFKTIYRFNFIFNIELLTLFWGLSIILFYIVMFSIKLNYKKKFKLNNYILIR